MSGCQTESNLFGFSKCHPWKTCEALAYLNKLKNILIYREQFETEP